nr:putative receptor-like protein kinase At3g47110 [Coffea arabica]
MPRLLISIPATRRVPLALLTAVALYFTSIPLDTASTKTMKGQKEADDRDVVALLAFKSKIQHDPYGIMNSWNDSHGLCRWEGIQCGRKHKRVTSINLKDKGLVGFLSPFLGNLSFLRALNLTNNTFQDEIPAQFGQLFRLQILSLSCNSIEGEIPANLSRCSSLVQLSLSYNKLVGRLPPAFGFLRNLETLAILTNDLTGAIPSSLGNLTSLTSLAVADNHLLHGSLPSALGLMLPHLRYLLLADNQFTGMLPASITNASDLTTIDIGNNRFKGKIAFDFGGLPNLVVLFAPDNNFGSGELDEMHFLSTMTNWSNLVGVDLGSNQLKGVLPSNIGNLSQFFRILSLGDNHIYGGIPSVLGNLVSLYNLVLEGNQLTGSIPSTIGNLQKLQMLALDSNKLSGKVPDSLGNLSIDG